MATLQHPQSTHEFLTHSTHPVIEAAAAAYTAASPPPLPSKKCDAHTCPWWPYSSSKDFRTNACIILLIVFLAVFFALTLNAAFRCLLRKRRRLNRNKPGQRTDDYTIEEPPPVQFKTGMKLAGAEPECAICLTEFVEGDGIRVMEKCNHGFHAHCIKKWLNSRSSCPVCRTVCETGDLEFGGNERRGPQAPLV